MIPFSSHGTWTSWTLDTLPSMPPVVPTSFSLAPRRETPSAFKSSTSRSGAAAKISFGPVFHCIIVHQIKFKQVPYTCFFRSQALPTSKLRMRCFTLLGSWCPCNAYATVKPKRVSSSWRSASCARIPKNSFLGVVPLVIRSPTWISEAKSDSRSWC